MEAYFASLDGLPRDIAHALSAEITSLGPHLSLGLAWGFPCWTGHERVFSLIAHKARCNLQLWNGARLADAFPDLVEGTGKALRHVKVTSVDAMDDGLSDLVEAAIALDRLDPQKVR
ncbi:DUF1801 domain-containing protein [Hyphomonas johnsonii]|uniref:DUF1801 domain-containing protein n=1 Tax=Hyphomonas johnsonii TaxID=81031 RepID=UPI00138DE1BB|nr:DUF1801 domain-containing protein [Hyphomonas johnsonii]